MFYPKETWTDQREEREVQVFLPCSGAAGLAVELLSFTSPPAWF
jgi:hypothetical protein